MLHSRPCLDAAVPVDTSEIGHYSESRIFIQAMVLPSDIRNGTTEMIALRIAVGVDFQPAVSRPMPPAEMDKTSCRP